MLALCQRLRAIVCVLSALLLDDVILICVCLRLREQCVCSRKKTSVARVAHVLLFHPISGNMDVNTLASKRSELIGNAAIVRKRRVIHNKSTCVCLCLPVAVITQTRRNASFDLWPALNVVNDQFYDVCVHAEKNVNIAKLRWLFFKYLKASAKCYSYVWVFHFGVITNAIGCMRYIVFKLKTNRGIVLNCLPIY